MKLLVLHWGTRGGGPQLQAGLAASLVESGACSLLVSYDAQSEVAENLAALRVPRLVVGQKAKGSRYRLVERVAGIWITALRLAIFCRQNRVDVVFEVMGHPLQLLPRLLVRCNGTKVLGSVHDVVRHQGEENTLLSFLESLSRRNLDGIMTYSTTVREQLEKRIGSPVFETVHPAFGVPASTTKRLDDKSRPIIVGFFGRIEKYKGIERLLRAVLILREEGRSIRLLIVGRGELTSSEAVLVKQVDASLRTEWISEEEIQDVVASFDILALPYNEASQSGVIGLALNSAVPIVCTPVGGLAEQVRRSNAGIISEDLSDGAFARSIAGLVDNPGLYAKLSKQALSSAQSTFSWEHFAQDVVLAGQALVGDVR